MNDFNPYQTPASDEPAQGCWRRGALPLHPLRG